jgi:hypothetical protein
MFPKICEDVQNSTLITGFNDTGEQLFTAGVNDTAINLKI